MQWSCDQDCSVDQLPPPPESEVELGMQWSCDQDCSVDQPPSKSEVELGMQWSCDQDCSVDQSPPQIRSWTWDAVKLWSGL